MRSKITQEELSSSCNLGAKLPFMITIKTPEEIKTLREGGKILAQILHELSLFVAPGVSTKDINDIVNKLCKEHDAVPVFLHYRPHGAPRPYPASICVSINDEIVHGIPNEKPRILKGGDVVSLDMGIKYKGLITDSAITVGVGTIDAKAKKLLEATEKGLYAAIDAAKVGAKTGDIGYALEKCVKPYGFGLPVELGGHGVGYAVHEDPFIPNFGKKGQGPAMKPGMVVAIEPMVNEGTADTIIDDDGYTFRTADGKRSAHFEHTIVITESGPEILTKL
jgi:methionyl aminopeptidase